MLPRSFMHWRWYHDANTARVFLHLVMSANYTEHDFEGITVHPGQAVTSRQSLAAALKLSEQQVRTALKHLKATGDITVKTTSKFSVVTINSFDRFQPSVNTSTNARPTGNRPSADFQPHYNKGIKGKGNTSFPEKSLSEMTGAAAKKSEKQAGTSCDLWAASRAIIRGNV